MMHSKFDWFGAMVRMMALIKMQMFQECHDIINKSKIEAFPKKTHAAFENLRLQAENGLKEKLNQVVLKIRRKSQISSWLISDVDTTIQPVILNSVYNGIEYLFIYFFL